MLDVLQRGVDNRMLCVASAIEGLCSGVTSYWMYCSAG